MKIHHLRNATFIIESAEHFILVDPMLSGIGELPPFAYFRHKNRRNPLVPLPDNADQILNKVSHCLVTHSQKLGIELLTHTDHFDKAGKSFLLKNKIPVTCRPQDASYMTKKGLQVHPSADYWQAIPFLGGTLTAIPALHGHGVMHHFMANGAGFVVQLPNEPSIYISGDTVHTKDVHRALTEYQPDIAVVACGNASLDIGDPILMDMAEIITFIETAPKKVIANHLEALNHCPTTREQLKQELEGRGLLEKTYIPYDGESFSVK